ncbi:aminotransferase class V-fold PLP-dependent enzyme [Micromonospora auratinigra]|uniref:cysteine desulfurase n=1 Tax=Micromonospora auratinigra TaxID=261654 RepID=A0A1A8ZGP4_9ACTN|nr:cysteine desulfurase [Micromonospora auratinigra]SBT42994.1 cysteine desulfurase / selenocysteine lyase [Micromonospora auratinigra]
MTGTTWQGDVDRRTLPTTVRDDFPFFGSPEGTGLAYLDNAATTQKPAAVLAAVTDYYTTANSNVGRGYYRLSQTSTERFEAARETVRRAIDAEHPDEVLFTSGTTHAVNLLAATLGRRLVGPGDRMLVTGMEHNSNLLPWRRLAEQTGAELVAVPVDADGRVSADVFAAALGPRVRLAAIAHVSNVLGTVNPVREMIAQAHRHGVPVVVDGAQAVPHRQVDVRALDADFYCFSGHKVYGPMGVGVLYGRRDLLAELPPYQVGGGTVKGVSLTEPVRYLTGPPRFEAGTPDVAGAVGLAAALSYLDGLGWAGIREHDRTLVRHAVRVLGALDGVRVVGDPARDPAGIVSFVVEGIHPYDVGGQLDRHRIAARCGVHCASVFLDDLGLLGTVRLSFGVYNTLDDVDRVAEAVAGVRPGFWTTEHPTTRFL